MPPLVRKTLHVKTGEGNASYGGRERSIPFPSSEQSREKTQHFGQNGSSIPQAERQTLFQVSAALNLNKMPGSYTLVSNRKKLPVPWTPGTSYELFASNPISGGRHACACHEQSLHVEITVQRGVFSRLYEERVRFFVSSSVLVTDIYVPVQPSQTKPSAGKMGGAQPTLRYCLHLKLNTCKVHLVMVPFRGTASGEQIPDTEEIKDALMACIIKGGCT